MLFATAMIKARKARRTGDAAELPFWSGSGGSTPPVRRPNSATEQPTRSTMLIMMRNCLEGQPIVV